jgi:hypothetical protein
VGQLILVRSMRACVITVAFALVGCATDVLGPYKHSISEDDVDQIRALITLHPEIHKGYLRIGVTRPDCVYVQTAPTLMDEIGYTFIACRKNGRWQIKEGSIQEPRVTVVIQNIPVVEHR